MVESFVLFPPEWLHLFFCSRLQAQNLKVQSSDRYRIFSSLGMTGRDGYRLSQQGSPIVLYLFCHIQLLITCFPSENVSWQINWLSISPAHIQDSSIPLPPKRTTLSYVSFCCLAGRGNPNYSKQRVVFCTYSCPVYCRKPTAASIQSQERPQ